MSKKLMILVAFVAGAGAGASFMEQWGRRHPPPVMTHLGYAIDNMVATYHSRSFQADYEAFPKDSSTWWKCKEECHIPEGK